MPTLATGLAMPLATNAGDRSANDTIYMISRTQAPRINRIGLWCMTNGTDPIGFPCPMGECRWIYDELKAWRTETQQ